MEVPLSVSLEAKLSQLATREGREPGALVTEAVQRLIEYDEWFLAKVDGGLASAAAGNLIPHQEVVERMRARLLRRHSAAQ